MEKEYLNFKIYKMGPKLGLFFPKELIKKLQINIGDHIKLNIHSNGKYHSFLSKLNEIVTIRKEIIHKLNLYKNQIINIRIEKPTFSCRSKQLFYEGKIDLLYLIPEENRLGFKILVNEFSKDEEIWLKIWYSFNRGSCREIELRRFLEINKFGKFLGLFQSEGTKTNINLIEFCNKSLFEHSDFLTYLDELGINKKDIIAKLDFHSTIGNIPKIVNVFEKKTKIRIRYKVLNSTSAGGYGYKLIIRSRLLAEIIYNSLNTIVSEIMHETQDTNIITLRDAFFSKLLSGDGSVEIMTKNRKKPQARLKISDGNFEYLKNYKSIMEKYGLNPHINQKYKYVRSLFSNKLAEKLLEIGAFENNPNQSKLKNFTEACKVRTNNTGSLA